MKIAVYDPFSTFTPFAEWLGRKRDDGKEHDVDYYNVRLDMKGLQWLHVNNDLVWYEFTDQTFLEAMNTLSLGKTKIVNRLHSYELFTDIPSKVNWRAVDKLLTVSPWVKVKLEESMFEVDFPPMDILFNGVDLDKFKIDRNKKYGKRIAVVGFINYKKNLPLAVYCLDQMRKEGYELHFVGQSQDRRFDLYLEHILKALGLRDKVFFHGKVEHSQMPTVLSQMDYILSTSLFESFGQGITEGIASGCLPLIHNFPGAAERFGSEHVFTGIEDFDNQISCMDIMSDLEKNEQASANRFMIEDYDLKHQKLKLDQIIDEIEESLE